MRRLAMLAAMALVTGALIAGLVGGMAAQSRLKVAMVTDIGGLGDQSFNDSAYRGLKQAEAELGVQIGLVESQRIGDYETNLRSLADQRFDLIWAIGFLMTDAIDEAAQQFPHIKFGIIDSVVDRPNVLSVTFKEEEGSFLVGVLAGLWTKTNRIGFVGGMTVPIIEKFEAGFVAGVRAVNPNAEIIIGYAGSFIDPAKGKEIAFAQYNQGVDIIYHASGATGLGVIEAARERNLFAIGVDSDQSHLAPQHVVASMIKRVDVGVFTGAKLLVEGAFKPGHIELGLKENGVGVAYTPALDIPKDIRDAVDRYAAEIKAGQRVVPYTRAQLGR